MSASPASYKLVLDQSRQAPWWPTTTTTATAWTWNSKPRPPDPLPPGWTCTGKGGGGRATGCSFEPLLFLRYRTGAGVSDVVPAGTKATISVSVGHQEHAAATPITGVTAQVSFDDGGTWTPVTRPDRTGPVPAHLPAARAEPDQRVRLPAHHRDRCRGQQHRPDHHPRLPAGGLARARGGPAARRAAARPAAA